MNKAVKFFASGTRLKIVRIFWAPLFLLSFSLGMLGILGLATSRSAQAQKHRRTHENATAESQVWLPALAHLDRRKMSDSFEKLTDRWIARRSSNKEVHLFILQSFVRGKDRQALNQYVARVWRAKACAPLPPAEELVQIATADALEGASEEKLRAQALSDSVVKDPEFCHWLHERWREDLSPLLFYDATASQLEDVRNLLLEKDCAAARELLERLIRREGESLYLLEKLESVAECLEDEAFEVSVANRLKKLEELRL